MNQILETKDPFYFYYRNWPFENKSKKNYLIIFIFSVIICILIFFYLLFSYLTKIKQNQVAGLLKEKYSIVSLYNNDNQYNAVKLSDEISIIGLIEIPAINISYPILSNSNENLLKISVCRFSGPLPNRMGNLCIAGHNYRNSMLFSKLDELNLGDSIFITDLNSVRLEYTVYNKFKVKENDLDCIKETEDIQVTLITCRELNNKERIVIKAKAKG